MTTEERKDHVLAVMDFIEKELSSTYKLPILDFFPVASNTFGRELPWGRLDICDVENSDFPRLQRLVFEGNCINKLRDMTQVMTLQRETERSLQEALHHSTVKVYLSKVLGAAQSAKWVVDEIVLTAFWVLLPVIVVVWLSAQM